MDFCQLLHKAKKNDQTSSTGGRYYSTKFEPPKKIKKESKDLSANVKKFLAKQAEEEKKKQLEEQRKKGELLALRAQDKKATRRVNVMLKRTKSANQSVIDDAVDKTHTAVTRAGPEQPDEDDYGYVSQEASALYEKMMEKYSQMPEEPKFNLFKKKVSTNLSSTKDRVKAALEKEKEEAMQPRKRKRRKREDGNEEETEEKDGDILEEVEMSSHSKDAPTSKPKPKLKPAPPPMSFTELLKMAAQKQHEPIIIEEKPQEEEKLYTKKQRKELEREKEWREKKERRDRERDDKERHKIAPGGESKILERQLTRPLPSVKIPNKDKPSGKPEKAPSNGLMKPPSSNGLSTKPPSGSRSELEKKNTLGKNSSSVPSRPPEPQRVPKVLPPSQREGKDVIPRKNNGASSQVPGNKVPVKPKEFPPRDLKLQSKPPRQFPPGDVRGVKRKQPVVSRGRILDDDDEEYDSEMDDFIDDDPQEGDYSKYIKEIFGYDRARYRDVDDDVDNMESSFAQQMKEEVISTKIGIMEDLEDIKKEEEEKRRKVLMKKKMKR